MGRDLRLLQFFYLDPEKHDNADAHQAKRCVAETAENEIDDVHIVKLLNCYPGFGRRPKPVVINVIRRSAESYKCYASLLYTIGRRVGSCRSRPAFGLNMPPTINIADKEGTRMKPIERIRRTADGGFIYLRFAWPVATGHYQLLPLYISCPSSTPARSAGCPSSSLAPLYDRVTIKPDDCNIGIELTLQSENCLDFSK